MTIAQWHELFKIPFIVMSLLIIIVQVLYTTSEFVKKYKRMQSKIRKYERLVKEGKLYV